MDNDDSLCVLNVLKCAYGNGLSCLFCRLSSKYVSNIVTTWEYLDSNHNRNRIQCVQVQKYTRVLCGKAHVNTVFVHLLASTNHMILSQTSSKSNVGCDSWQRQYKTLLYGFAHIHKLTVNFCVEARYYYANT